MMFRAFNLAGHEAGAEFIEQVAGRILAAVLGMAVALL